MSPSAWLHKTDNTRKGWVSVPAMCMSLLCAGLCAIGLLCVVCVGSPVYVLVALMDGLLSCMFMVWFQVSLLPALFPVYVSPVYVLVALIDGLLYCMFMFWFEVSLLHALFLVVSQEASSLALLFTCLHEEACLCFL